MSVSHLEHFFFCLEPGVVCRLINFNAALNAVQNENKGTVKIFCYNCFYNLLANNSQDYVFTVGSLTSIGNRKIECVRKPTKISGLTLEIVKVVWRNYTRCIDRLSIVTPKENGGYILEPFVYGGMSGSLGLTNWTTEIMSLSINKDGIYFNTLLNSYGWKASLELDSNFPVIDNYFQFQYYIITANGEE